MAIPKNEETTPPAKTSEVPSDNFGTESQTSTGSVQLGYGLTGTLPKKTTAIAGYINGLASSNPQAFQQIAQALIKAGLPIRNFEQVGAAIGRIVGNMTKDPNTPISGITLETFLNSINKNFQFGKPTKPPTQQYYLTTLPAASAEINDLFEKVLGVAASPQEQKAYYKELLKAQKKTPMVTTSADGKVVQTAGFSGAEKEALLNRFVAQRAQNVFGKGTMVGGTKIETASPEQFTGEFLKNINVIKAYSSAYGIPMSDSDMKKAAITALTSPAGIEGQQEKIKSVAKGIYSGLAQYIDDNLTPQELLKPYISMKAKILEIPEEQISLNSTEGQQVISKVVSDKGLLPIYNYERELRQDPRWRFTKNANEEASNWVSSIMKSFGIAG
jgi:hypothetical protein